VPFNEISTLRKKIGPSTCAVLVEPIQGEGGVRCPDPEYLKAVRQTCDETGTLLIFDEIQTGMGRTGKLFAYEHFGIAPDIMTLAKALANGLPIGAMLAREEIADAFGPGSHASTFGGTPVVTAASLEVVRVLLEENIIDHCKKIGTYFKERLEWLKNRHELIEDVRYGSAFGNEAKNRGGSDCCFVHGKRVSDKLHSGEYFTVYSTAHHRKRRDRCISGMSG